MFLWRAKCNRKSGRSDPMPIHFWVSQIQKRVLRLVDHSLVTPLEPDRDSAEEAGSVLGQQGERGHSFEPRGETLIAKVKAWRPALRPVQEGLGNAYRHGGDVDQRIVATWSTQKTRVHSQVGDSMPHWEQLGVPLNLRPVPPRSQRWWVRQIDEQGHTIEESGHVFVGDVEAMIRHINELHLRTDIAHAAREIEE